ncbi:Putative gfo/Idh/MocA-like oxidoreductase, NAD(P)-binding domain superfamily [Septoria linicola]|uniref:Gfo/Idh/MocA-like oxidoreductase, NAD(P)-binding domain superfamily n=1 Tax=Septoria linicola TaxID=215465 RepID=A0A9Q9ASQ2_9PEZI|nr:Putative gfo/Idh/MocA-like oxidoreductase, NAD(P)-binding domain superfamily [Septoria linicola]
MAPLMNDDAGQSTAADRSESDLKVGLPRLLIIGAGSRGNAYARAAVDSGLGIVTAVAEPVDFKRRLLGSRYIWPSADPTPEQEFRGWQQYTKYEQQRRKDEAAGIPVPPGVDGVFICVHDEHHIDVLTAIAPLGLHIMAEKPLATTLAGCLKVEKFVRSAEPRIFAIGHVLRYSPHNMLLRHLVREKRVIGDVLSIEHTEPVGWWHFSHSYVRGHWRKESTTAPSLLTKSCHDIDFILWMLCSPLTGSQEQVHLPARLSSSGSLKQYRRAQKPKEAGSATNCVSCPIGDTCKYSATRIYNDRHLAVGKAKWPVEIVNPETEHILATDGPEQAKSALLKTLSEDYNSGTTPLADIEGRSWYGRCVWESDNDVCDDQYVTIEWDDGSSGLGSKTASFHMIAQTLAQCERRGRIYGTSGEISYDSKSITIHDFTNNTTSTCNPEVPKNSHHGGGDDGLTQQFLKAVAASKSGRMSVDEAQVEYLGCTMEEIIRSHAAVFAAEEARRERKVVDWQQWWQTNVAQPVEGSES